MKYSNTMRLTLSAIALALISGVTYAQTKKIDLGQQEYVENCAVCHALSGKGGGPYVEFLRKSPPDLTQMAKTNGGVFPVNRVYETIEGANVPSHGSRDMPIWGMDYRIKAAEYFVDVPYDSEAYVRARILTLLEYINRLQQR